MKRTLQLKEAFNLDDINQLPIIYNIAWYEQKAVIVVIFRCKKYSFRPTLLAFLSPNVANVLVDNFNIAKIQSVEEDMKLFFVEQ